MSCFSYSNEGNGLYLVYETDAQEQVNTAIVRKLIEKKREGLVKTQYASSETGKQFKYDINSMITLKQFLQQGINDKTYCAILHSVAATLELLKKEDIGVCNLVLNEELIYYDSITKVVNFICIPTSSFNNSVTSEVIIYEFSKLIISRMEVTSNLILEMNEFISRGNFTSEEFNCLINSVLIMSNADSSNKSITIREYSEDEPLAYEENAFKQLTIKSADKNSTNTAELPMNNQVKKSVDIKDTKKKIMDFTLSAKKVLKDKMGGLSKDISSTIGNVKNNINSNVESTYQQNIRAEVEKQREEEKQRMEDVRKNFEENRIFNNQINGVYEGGNGKNNTVIIDCVTGDVADGNAVNTSNAYLVRESTGEKIYIDSNNFKLGRSKKFVDYYIGGNDTVSKVHAYITSDVKGYFLVDNSSRNHTFLDGKMLEPVKQMILGHRAKIKLAKEEFTFYLY